MEWTERKKDTFAAVFCEAHKKGERTMANGFTRPIPVAKLRQHPKNVRKTYDDIEELTASVRENGVMQNLTVVKDPADAGYYLVIIGNRRLMAARAAGLDYLHCNVVEMTEAEQLATMLTENMQRKDLTLVEESNGVQMCLDLGISEKDLQKRTGLSRETIRTRKKIASLELKEECKNATVQEYLQVAELKNEENRAEALEQIGTEDFNWKINELKRKEQKEEFWEKIKPLLDKHATEMQDSVPYYRIERSWEIVKIEAVKEIEWEEGAEYVYSMPSYSISVKVYKLRPQDEEGEAEEEERCREEAQNRKDAREEGKRKAAVSRATRLQYIKNVFDCEPIDKKKIIKWLARIKFMWDSPDFDIYDEVMGVTRDEDEEVLTEEEILQDISNSADTALALIYATLETLPERGLPTMTGRGEFREDRGYQTLYDFMVDFGYKPSREEWQLLDGTHKVFYQDEEE